jgi:Acyl-CoA synthetases (AMP-forming)/AMP-acid ligases II
MPTRPALRQGERVLSYAELSDRSRRLANALIGSGVAKGDRVAYLGANDIALFETLFAAGLVGAIFVPLNTRLSGPEVHYMLEDSGARVLVFGSDAAKLVEAAAPLPMGVRTTIALGEAREHSHDYEQFLATGGDGVPVAQVDLSEPALILYTSGTTGRPKGAVLTHGNLTFNTMNQLAHFDVVGSDKALCISPLFHVVGLGQVTLPTLFKGGSVEVVPRFDAGAILAMIGHRGVTSFSAVPTMLQMMCEHESFDSSDLSSLKYVVYGGSAVQERVAREWLSRGVHLYQGYGMTEASPGVYMAVEEGAELKPVSVGVPHFFTDVAGLEDGRPVPMDDGVARELLVRGPNIFAGYWGHERESAEARVSGEWFRTGDVLRVDEEGWASVVERVKDMIISGGENIYPAEVEAVMFQLDEIELAAVVAAPDERWGEVGAAFVVRRSGAQLSEADLRAHLLSNLARYKVPKYLTFVEELPRTATGKVRRGELRSRAAAEVQATSGRNEEGAS